MAKIYKISGYIVDANGDLNEDEIPWLLGRYDYSVKHLKIESADIGEWYDEIPINYCNSDISECEKYFKNKEKENNEMVT